MPLLPRNAAPEFARFFLVGFSDDGSASQEFVGCTFDQAVARWVGMGLTVEAIVSDPSLVEMVQDKVHAGIVERNKSRWSAEQNGTEYVPAAEMIVVMSDRVNEYI